MHSLRLDLVLAVRRLSNAPGFTAAAVLTLALGIGATSAAFSLLDSLFWRPLAGIEEPDRVAILYSREADSRPGVASYVDFRDFQELDRAGGRAFAYLAALKSLQVPIVAGDVELPGAAVLITEDLFRAFGTLPALGRLDVAAPGSAVISHALWQGAFEGSRAVLGSTVLVRGVPLTVVGVAPARFRPAPLDSAGDVFVSMELQPLLMGEDLLERRGWGGVFLAGRLAPGVTVEAAQARIDVFAARLAREHPRTNGDRTYLVEPLALSRLSPGTRGTVAPIAGLLSASVLAVLLIACANVAGLLSVRAVRRSREVAIRSALGAGRSALARQLLAESLVLAGLGGLAGLALAALLIATAGRLPFPFPLDLAIDLRVAAFTAAASVLCGLLFGLLPAVHAARRSLAPLLARADRPAGTRLRSVLVVTQVSLSLSLLLVSALLLRTVMELRQVQVGFDPVGLVVAEVGSGLDGGAAAYSRIVDRMRSTPGVEGASLVSVLPGEDSEDRLGMRPEGAGLETVSLRTVVAGDGYFETVGVPLLEGRELRPGDDARAPLAAVVNRSLAERFWPGRGATGRRIALVGTDQALTVVGVVPDTRIGDLRRASDPTVFVSYLQAPTVPAHLHLVLRTGLPQGTLAAELRAATVAEGAWGFGVTTLEERLRGSVAAERAVGVALGGFGLTALLLAAVGLYGLLAFAVGERRHEIGVRMALGADAGRVRRLVIRRGLALAGLGAAIGLGVGVSVARPLEGLLYGVGHLDPASLVGSTLLLVAVALVASWIPAARAAALDPLTVLRKE